MKRNSEGIHEDRLDEPRLDRMVSELCERLGPERFRETLETIMRETQLELLPDDDFPPGTGGDAPPAKVRCLTCGEPSPWHTCPACAGADVEIDHARTGIPHEERAERTRRLYRDRERD